MALATPEPLEMHRGDRFIRALLNVQWDDGTAITWGVSPKSWFTAKRKRTDPDAQAVVLCTSTPADGLVIDTLNNKITLTIAESKTAAVTGDINLDYDVQVQDTAGRTGTVKWGSLRIRFDTTHATT